MNDVKLSEILLRAELGNQLTAVDDRRHLLGLVEEMAVALRDCKQVLHPQTTEYENAEAVLAKVQR